MSLAAHYRDPIIDTIARAIHALFPRCVSCGEMVERYEEADVRILANRVVHRRCMAIAASGTDGAAEVATR
jgi:hypothetical protein